MSSQVQTTNSITACTATVSNVFNSSGPPSYGIENDAALKWGSILPYLSSFSYSYTDQHYSNLLYAFKTIGHPVVNGTQETEVNVIFGDMAGSAPRANYTIWFSANWTVQKFVSWPTRTAPAMLTEYGNGANASAQVSAGWFGGAFDLSGWLAGYTLQTYPGLVRTGTSNQTFGSLTLPITTYESRLCQDGQSYSLDISVGQLPTSNVPIVFAATLKDSLNNVQYNALSASLQG